MDAPAANPPPGNLATPVRSLDDSGRAREYGGWDHSEQRVEGSGMAVEKKLEQALRAFLGSTIADLFWYALMACAVWLFFYVAFRTAFRQRRVSRQDPTRRQVGREIIHSLRSVVVFGLV